MLRAVLVAASIIALAGCAGINEGMSDIRRPVSQGADEAAGWVVRGEAAGQDVVQPDDTVLITIDRLFVKGFDELNFSPGNVLTGGRVFEARGEMAVLVAVQDGASPISNTTMDDHYVVFYSNDTREGQFSNFRNQRVFGPVKVSGNHLSLEVVLLEIDRPTDEDNALIGKLAALGKQLGGVTYGPTFNVLADLGSSLLSTPNDDVEMRFRFNFDLGNRPNARLPLVPGLYALVREEGRGFPDYTDANGRTVRDYTRLGATTDWANLCLNTDTGELHHLNAGDRDGTCQGQRYVDNTYLVINVEAGLPENAVTNERFSAFVSELRTVPDPATGAFSEAVTALAQSYAREEREAAIWNALSQLRNSANHYGQTRARTTCNSALANRLAVADQALMRDVVDLHALIVREAGRVGSTDADLAYSESVFRAQVQRLLDFFGPLSWGAEGEPTETPVALMSRASDPSQFTAVFGEISDFHQRVQGRARELWPDRVCPAQPATAT